MFSDQQTYQPKMLPTGEAAKRLNVSPQTVRDWTASGKLVAQLTQGGHRQYREDDIALLALAERGITTYWVDDVVIKMDGQMRVSVIGAGNLPFSTSNPEEVELERYRRHHNGLEVTPRELALTQQPKVLEPSSAETVHDDAGNLIAQTYLAVFALERQECARLLQEHIPAAVKWLQSQVRPVHSVAKWVMVDGQEVRSAY